MNLIFTLVLLLFSASAAWANHSALHTLATSMRPGQWANLNVTGQLPGGTSIFQAGPGYILEYDGKGTWDSVNKRSYYMAASHVSSQFHRKAVYYDEATNSWNVLNDNCGQDDGSGGTWCDHLKAGHAYDMQTADNAGNYYQAGAGGDQHVVIKYNATTSTWSTLPSFQPYVQCFVSCVSGLVFFPEMGTQGSVLFIDGSWGIARWDIASSTWSRLASGCGGGGGPTYCAGNYETYANYSGGLVVFGGGVPTNNPDGDRQWYKLDSSGTLSAISTLAHCGAILTGTGQGQFVSDPQTGNFVLMCGTTGTEYMLNPVNGTWTSLRNQITPPSGLGNNLDSYIGHTAIPAYNVVMVFGLSTTYLWKPNTSLTARCSAAGVVRCVDFDAAADITGVDGDNTGLLPNNNSPTRDTTVAASGDSSLKFVVPSNSSAPGGGDYFANFSTDLKTRFGANQSFFIQWRQRFNSDFLNTGYWGQFLVTDGGTLTFSATSGNGVTATIAGGSVTFTGWEGRAISDSNLVAYANIVSVTDATHAVVNITGTLPSTTFTSGNWLHTFGNAGGWKQLIVGGGDVPGSSCSSSSTNDCTSTCTSNDIVVQNTNQATYPQTYSICNYFIPHVISFNNPNFGGSGDFKEQTARTDPFCTYLQRNAGTPYANRNCFRYVADEWMTFQLGVDLGAEGTGCEVGRCDGGYPAYVDSRIRLWVARDGQPSELVMDTIFDVDAGDQLNRSQVCCIVDSKKIGKVILLPYHTGKAGAQVHPEGDIWYDELIISTQQIADPTATGGGGSPGDTTPPMINITSPTTNPTYSTSSSSIDISGTASDNVGVTSVTWSCDVCGSGSATGTTSWSITGITLQSGVNVITVTAGDAAANTGSDTLTVTYTPPPSSISIKLSGSTTKKIGAGVTEKVGKQ